MSTPTDYGWMGLLPREVAEGSQCGRPVLPRERNGIGNLNCMILTADSLQVRKDGGVENFTLSSCVLLLILVLAPTPRLG